MSSRCLSNDREIGLAMFALEFLKANLDDEVDEIFLESEFAVGDYPPTEEEIADLMTAIKRPEPMPTFLSPADYARFGGRFCPVCRHQTVEYGALTSVGQEAWCATCNAEWHDQNKLDRYVDLSPNGPAAGQPRGVTTRVEAVVVVAGSDGEETSFPTDFLVLHEYGRLDEAAILRFAQDIEGFVRIQEHTLTEVL